MKIGWGAFGNLNTKTRSSQVRVGRWLEMRVMRVHYLESIRMWVETMVRSGDNGRGIEG